MFTKSPISSSSSGLALAVSDLALLGSGGWLASFSAFSLAFFSALSLLFCSLQWSLWVLGAHHVVLKCVYERPSDSFCVFLYIGFRIHMAQILFDDCILYHLWAFQDKTLNFVMKNMIYHKICYRNITIWWKRTWLKQQIVK